MENYIMTLTRNNEGGMEIYVEDYDGSLEQLHRCTKSETVMIYNANQYLRLICPPYGVLDKVLVVCDDDGKLKNKPITLPILNYKHDVVDCFVGDLSFIAECYNEVDDRGLTKEEAERLIEELKLYVGMFPVLPKIERVTWLV